MISDSLITNAIKTMNASKGIAIYQICEKLGINVDENSRYIASVLRKNDFNKEHQLTTISSGKRAYLWFSKNYLDPKDKQIKALSEEVLLLQKRIVELEALQINSFVQELQNQAIQDTIASEPIQEPSRSKYDEITDEEMIALRLALSDD